MVERFITEYWIFVEALLEHASKLSGVATLNAHAASLGYPFAAAVLLSALGFVAGLTFLRLGRPGWGLAGLAVGEELSALSAASAAFAHGASIDGAHVVMRFAAVLLAVVLVSAFLRRALRLSRERVPAGPRIPPAW
jgi:hypothetical protein